MVSMAGFGICFCDVQYCRYRTYYRGYELYIGCILGAQDRWLHRH